MRLALPLTLCLHQTVTADSLLEPTRTSYARSVGSALRSADMKAFIAKVEERPHG